MLLTRSSNSFHPKSLKALCAWGGVNQATWLLADMLMDREN